MPALPIKPEWCEWPLPPLCPNFSLLTPLLFVPAWLTYWRPSPWQIQRLWLGESGPKKLSYEFGNTSSPVMWVHMTICSWAQKTNTVSSQSFFFLIVLFLWDSHCYMYGLSKYVWDIHLCFLIALVGSLNVQQDSKRHPSHYIAWVIPVIIYVGLELGSLYSLRTECIPVII